MEILSKRIWSPHYGAYPETQQIAIKLNRSVHFMYSSENQESHDSLLSISAITEIITTIITGHNKTDPSATEMWIRTRIKVKQVCEQMTYELQKYICNSVNSN